MLLEGRSNPLPLARTRKILERGEAGNVLGCGGLIQMEWKDQEACLHQSWEGNVKH